MDLSTKKILFISSGFYQYDDLIIMELEKLGAKVFYYLSAPTNSHTSMRIYQRVDLLKRLYCKNLLKKVKRNNYDYLFMLNTARLTTNFVKEVTSYCKNSIKILYCWDSMKTLPEVVERIKYFDLTFTFEPSDANTYNMNFLPLFYSKERPSQSENKFLFSFVGFGHSDRYNFLKYFIKYSNKNSRKSAIYLYLPSILYFLRGKYISKTFKNAKLNEFQYKSISEEKVIQIMAESEIVLDYQVGSQTGLTMRTIETLGMHKKLITTNKDIVNYDFYTPKNILIVEKDRPWVTDEFIKNDYRVLGSDIYNKYSLRHWLEHMFFYKEFKDDKYYNADL